MQVLQLIVIVLIGLSLGVVGAQARVPNLKWIPHLSFVILGVGCYAGLLVRWDISLIDSLLFLLALFTGNVLYAARLWQQLDLEPGLSYWAWVQRDFFHTGYLRRLYRSSVAVDSRVG